SVNLEKLANALPLPIKFESRRKRIQLNLTPMSIAVPLQRGLFIKSSTEHDITQSPVPFTDF
ncbi:MAG: hypothetical protein ACYT04_92850, partial [Nostoc sp.]